MPDPRRDQGRRHPLAFVPSLAACAVRAGAKSLAAIAEWAAEAPPNVLTRLGGPCQEPGRGPVAPAEATVRRVLQRIDGDALDTASEVGSPGANAPSARRRTTATGGPCPPSRSRWTRRGAR
ncbi:transposase family protein [Streptomyces sp. NPDC015684]|uniref:transposase family protein n=1 Tax=Streptomyces sp. NPDC015684 TaxID=3364963 RepID=UPI0036FCCBEC